MITGIIVALPDEINSLTSKKINKGDCVFINEQTLVICSGAGPKNAASASQRLIDKGAKQLISWGCAAALSPQLKPGDLVLPHQLLTEKGQIFSIESPWLKQTTELFSLLNPNTGLLAESSIIVAKSQDKETIYQQSNAVALDMESIAVATTAINHNLPVMVIRCIADPVAMSLPKAVSYALNNQGDVILSRLLRFLLTHPAELPGLIKLGMHFNAAKKQIKVSGKTN